MRFSYRRLAMFLVCLSTPALAWAHGGISAIGALYLLFAILVALAALAAWLGFSLFCSLYKHASKVLVSIYLAISLVLLLGLFSLTGILKREGEDVDVFGYPAIAVVVAGTAATGYRRRAAFS